MKILTFIILFSFLTGTLQLIGQDISKEVEVLINESFSYKFSNKDSCILLLQKALKLAENNNLQESELQVLNELNFVNRINRDFSLAIEFSKQVLKKSRSYKVEKYEGIALESIAIGFHRMNQLDSAIHYYDETIKFWDTKNKPHFGFISYHSLSQIYNVLYQKENAEQFKLNAYELAHHDEARPEWLFMALLDLVSFYRTAGNFELYSNYLEEALKDLKSISLEVKKLPMHLRMVLELEPELLEKEKIEKILEVHAKNQNWRSLELTYQKLGDIAFTDKNFEEAISNYNQALSLGDLNSKEGSLGSYYRLYESYNAIGNKEEALSSLEQYQKVRNLLQKERAENTIRELEVKYQAVEKEKSLLSERLKLEEEKRKNRNLFIVIAFITLVSALLYAVLVNVKRKKELALASLEVKSAEVEKLEQQNKLVAVYSTLEGQEKERGRMSIDLHDGLGGLLASIKVMFENVKFEDEKDVVKYQKTREMIDYACDEVRRIAHNITPPLLSAQGLTLALKNLLANFELSHSIQIEDDIREIGRYDETLEVFLYRIAQELLNNVAKHANSSKLEVSLYKLDAGLQLVVEDNGKGFNIENVEEGMGLSSIKSRVSYLNGEMEVNSSSVGTSIFITVPTI